MKKQRATIYIDAQLWRDFRAACVQRGYSASQIVESHIHEQMTAWMLASDPESYIGKKMVSSSGIEPESTV